MKKSTLKEVIKSEIKSLLLENQMDTDAAFKTLRTVLAFLKKHNSYPNPELMEKALDILQRDEVSRMMDREPSFKGTGERAGFDMRGIDESLNPEVSKSLDSFIKSMAKRYDYSEQDAVFAIQAALKQREFDKPADIPGFEGTMDALDSLSIREEEEPTSADIKKEKSIAKEKEDALKTKEEIDKIKKDLKKNKSEMLKISKIDRKDRTKAEQSLFDKMVDKTKELKKLERNL